MDNSFPKPLTPSVEDYLKAVYSISASGEAAPTSSLAEELRVQPASVTGMVKRLAEKGYLEHTRYRGVRLTEKGTREALKVIRRHRILETYLNLRLDYSWDDVHSEAECLEHAASEELIDRMAAALGYPNHDPHGSPIPNKAGEIEDSSLATLSETKTGTTVQIQAIQDEDPERLRYVQTLGLTPGVVLTVIDRAPYGGSMTLAFKDSVDTEVIGVDLANNIFVILFPDK
jgi:DtxR family Mn-dependent transcriptional regulator